MDKWTYLQNAGTYEGTVVAPESGWIGESGEKQTPYIKIPVVVMEDDREKVCVWQGWLTDAAMDRTFETLTKVFGPDWTMKDIAAGNVKWEGTQVEVVCEIETYNKKDRLKVRWLNAIGSAPAMKVMAKDKLDSLVAKLNSRASAVAKRTAAELKKLPAAKPVTDELPS